MTEGKDLSSEGHWLVIARQWQRKPGADAYIGKEIEVVDAPDRSAAITLAVRMLKRHAHHATSEMELEVSIAPAE